MSPDRLKGDDLEHRFHGSRTTSEPINESDPFDRAHAELLHLCAAYVPVGPRGFRFSHLTAARIYRFPLPDRLAAGPLDVTAPASAPQPRGKGVRGHRSDAGTLRTRHALPIVSPELAWLQLSMVLTLDELIVAGDFLVRRKRPLSTLTQLRAAVAAFAGRRGAQLARRALADIREKTDSPPESWVRIILVRAGLPEPLIRREVTHEGYFVGTPDLAYPRYRIALEYEGMYHRKAREFRDGIIRRELFEQAGWNYIQLTDDHIQNPRRLVALVTAPLASDKARLTLVP